MASKFLKRKYRQMKVKKALVNMRKSLTDAVKIEYYYSFLWRWSQQDAVYIGAPWPGARMFMNSSGYFSRTGSDEKISVKSSSP